MNHYIKVEDLKHAEFPYGIELIEIDDDGDYVETIDVFWFSTEHERDLEFKDLSF